MSWLRSLSWLKHCRKAGSGLEEIKPNQSSKESTLILERPLITIIVIANAILTHGSTVLDTEPETAERKLMKKNIFWRKKIVKIILNFPLKKSSKYFWRKKSLKKICKKRLPSFPLRKKNRQIEGSEQTFPNFKRELKLLALLHLYNFVLVQHFSPICEI